MGSYSWEAVLSALEKILEPPPDIIRTNPTPLCERQLQRQISCLHVTLTLLVLVNGIRALPLILVNTLYALSSTGIEGSGCQVVVTMAALASVGMGILLPVMFDSQAPGGAASLQMGSKRIGPSGHCTVICIHSETDHYSIHATRKQQ